MCHIAAGEGTLRAPFEPPCRIALVAERRVPLCRRASQIFGAARARGDGVGPPVLKGGARKPLDEKRLRWLR